MVNATGSRGLFSVRPALLLRLLIGAVVMLGLVALSAALVTDASAGAAGTVTVNSLSNTNDGQCNGPPNDTAVGNCTFREAINDVNAGLADEIHFHPAVFPQSTHGVIQLELGGPLPPIFREVKIDAKGVGVVLDGDFDNDGIGVPWGILVFATHNGFDFELNGGGSTFIVQDVGCSRLRGITGPDGCILGGGSDSVDAAGQDSVSQLLVDGVGILISGLCFGGEAGSHVAGIGCCGNTQGDSVAGLCCAAAGGSSVQGCLCPPKQKCTIGLPAGGEGEDAGPVVIGGPFSLGDIIIDGIEVHNAMASNGILMEATNLNNIHVTNSWIEADLNGIATFANSVGAPPDDRLTNNNVHINGNLISGGEGTIAFGNGGDQHIDISKLPANGVVSDFCCDLHSKITADVSNNDSITGNFGNGVSLSYCFLGGCAAADGSAWNFKVNDNGKIAGAFDAVNVGIFPDGNPPTSSLPHDGSHLNADVQVKGNAIMDAEADTGVNVEVDICCANSDNIATVAVDNNQDIVGDDNAVSVDQFVCCAHQNESHTTVNNNGELIGEGDEGVEIESHAGSQDGSSQDSDDNWTTVDVNGNADISGDNNDGVFVDASSGTGDGTADADTNKTEVNVNDNVNIDGDDDGVQVEALAGTQAESSGDANKNEAIVHVAGNRDIDGSENNGVNIDITAGTDPNGGPNVTGDDNSTKALVDNNDNIKGHNGDGVRVDSFAGGASPRGARNATSTTVTNNENITGQRGGDGVHTENAVCCDPSGTNNIVVSSNHNVIGNDGDGIDVHEICCSLNTVKIQNNDGVIKGNDEQGIEITPCLGSGDAEIPQDVTLDDVECMGDSVTILTITDNNVSNSGLDGILICCGAFQFPLNQAPAGAAGVALKSVIANNTVSHNGEDGIDLDTTTGINVTHNNIFLNGTSATDGDNGVEIDWQFAFAIWYGADGIPSFTFKVPAHFNRISENSIYDNVGLGINLIGITQPPLVQAPASGTESGTQADGVGCTVFALTPITANDCINYPKILFTGGPSVAKVSGSTCANCIVEIFVADETPADQPGPLLRQHGEGKTFLVSVHADALGAFSVNLPCGLASGKLTATATDKLKNTSEFASNIPFPGTPACAAATALPTDTPAPAQPTNTPVPPAPTNTAVPPAPTATAEPAGICGDVNSDGVVNSIDASLILQKAAGIIASLPKGDAAGDVNHNGVTNSIDATLILQNAAAMIGQSGLNCA